MRYVVTGEQMKQIDRYTIDQIGISALVLMERAALSVVEQMKPRLRPKDRIWVLCGNGNNGGDGIAIARILQGMGYQVLVLLVGDSLQGTLEFQSQLEIARQIQLPVFEVEDFIGGGCDVVVDALFGVGLKRPVEGRYKEALKMIEAKSVRLTVAVDLPSGIHSDSGQVMGYALEADLTVTFGFEKLGTMLYPGKAYAGQVVVTDIGFPRQSLEQVAGPAFTFEPADLSLLPKRPAYSNKGTFGKVLIVAGSEGMSGAAYLSALAAYRSGAGLVRLMTPHANREILQTLLPEAVLITYDPVEAADLTPGFRRLVESQCELASVVVLGPGLGTQTHVLPLVESVLSSAYVPVIIDADGLNTVASHPYLTKYFTENIILTPHVGEMARLTGIEIGQIGCQVMKTAVDYSNEQGVICVLKDAVSVVAGKDGQCYINASGNSCMAKAGAGDVLTGMIAGLIALGLEEFLAAALGVYLHGLSGDEMRKTQGAHSLLARDLTQGLVQVLTEAQHDTL